MKNMLLLLLLLNGMSLFAYETAFDKRAVIWEQIEESQFEIADNPIESVSLIQALNAFSSVFLTKTFTNVSDYMPVAREKIIHKSGSVALVHLEIDPASPYSGLLKDKKTFGLIRMSVAAGQSKSTFIPGMALKLFIDNRPSANMVAMNSLEGQAPNGDFFALPFSNKIPEPSNAALKFGAALFKRAMDLLTDDGNPAYLPLSNFTQYHNDGSEVAKQVTPHHLVFYPRIKTSTNINVDFRYKLEAIPAGTVLYDVYAVNSATSATSVKIGKLVTDSNFIASEFGDKVLFFQHNIK